MAGDIAERIVLALTTRPILPASSIVPEDASEELISDLESISASYKANKEFGYDFRTCDHMAKVEFVQRRVCEIVDGLFMNEDEK